MIQPEEMGSSHWKPPLSGCRVTHHCGLSISAEIPSCGNLQPGTTKNKFCLNLRSPPKDHASRNRRLLAARNGDRDKELQKACQATLQLELPLLLDRDRLLKFFRKKIIQKVAKYFSQ